MQVVHLCDYGIGNTLNVKRAFEKVGAKVHVCNTGSEIENAKMFCKLIKSVCENTEQLFMLSAACQNHKSRTDFVW